VHRDAAQAPADHQRHTRGPLGAGVVAAAQDAEGLVRLAAVVALAVVGLGVGAIPAEGGEGRGGEGRQVGQRVG
jgi:hypothetical protein